MCKQIFYVCFSNAATNQDCSIFLTQTKEGRSNSPPVQRQGKSNSSFIDRPPSQSQASVHHSCTSESIKDVHYPLNVITN